MQASSSLKSELSGLSRRCDEHVEVGGPQEHEVNAMSANLAVTGAGPSA